MLCDLLVNYGVKYFNLNLRDTNYRRNQISHFLGIYNNEPYQYNEESVSNLSPFDLSEILKEHLLKNNIVEEGRKCDEYIDYLISLVMPSPSEVDAKFINLYKKTGDLSAVLFLKDLGEKSNYINLHQINKNIKWESKFDSNSIEFTINLSKPEKSNADILRAAKEKSNNDDAPKCVLCYENEGYYGKTNKAPRSTIRMVPVTLNNNQWFLQLSPYVYYENHIILFNKNHSPMKIDGSTLDNLVSFVDQYPSFFLGSNADLPIVGGSILSHEHYQGGTHILPVMKAKPRFEYYDVNHTDCKIYYLDWFNSTFLVESKNKETLKEIYEKILNTWNDFSLEKLGIIAKTGETRHNTITPILRKENEVYKLYLILRCNNTSQEYPEGIFHVHPEYFNIKHEGIGLIEAQGLYILPGRLDKEINLIANYITLNTSIDEFLEMYPSLLSHKEMMLYLKEVVDKNANIRQQIIDYISNIGRKILTNTAVFKENEKEELDLFIDKLGLSYKE